MTFAFINLLSTVPKEFGVVDCTDSSITIEWFNDDSEDSLVYELVYQLQGSDNWNVLTIHNEDVLTVHNGRRTYTLENLLPETWYEIKMRAVDNHMKSLYTEYKERQTLKLGKGTFFIYYYCVIVLHKMTYISFSS